MDTIKKLAKVLIGAVLVIAGFSSCEKSELKPNYSATEINEPSPIVEATTWRVKSFNWHNRAENRHFEYYSFQIQCGWFHNSNSSRN